MKQQHVIFGLAIAVLLLGAQINYNKVDKIPVSSSSTSTLSCSGYEWNVKNSAGALWGQNRI